MGRILEAKKTSTSKLFIKTFDTSKNTHSLARMFTVTFYSPCVTINLKQKYFHLTTFYWLQKNLPPTKA
jgi:hypothetical protein